MSERVLTSTRSSSFVVNRRLKVSMLPDEFDHDVNNYWNGQRGSMCSGKDEDDLDSSKCLKPMECKNSIPAKGRASRISMSMPRTSMSLPSEDGPFVSGEPIPQHAMESPPTRVFNVGFSRSKKKVKCALATKEDYAKLRRYEEVFSDKEICDDKRFAATLIAMEEEFQRLQFRAERAEHARLDRLAAEERVKFDSTEAQKQFLLEVEEKKRQAIEKRRLALLAAEKRRKEAMQRADIRKRRLNMMKMASHLLGAQAEEEADEVDENGEVDLRKSRVWNPHYMWCCDIAEREGEKANDFLFLADLSRPTGGKRSKTSQRSGRCIFDSVMYDLSKFEPDYRDDGNIVFELRFGVKTKERPKVPQGWNIFFQVKEDGRGGYQGTCETSWWGIREVFIIPYQSMTPKELERFPDPVAKYFKSTGV